MKVLFENKAEFLAKVQKVQGVLDTRHTMPILSNILLQADTDGRVTLGATDLEIGIRDSLQAQVEEAGELTISGKKLFEILRELPEMPVSLSSEENNWVRLECGKSRFRVVGQPADRYPALPSVEHIPLEPIDRERMLLMVSKTMYAAGTDQMRLIMNGVLYVVEETYSRMVATDGHRLALVEFPHEEPRAEAPRKLVIGSKAVQQLRRMLQDGEGETIRFGADEANVVFEQGEEFRETVISKVIEGEYPDYTLVIPKNLPHRVLLPRDEMISLLRRVVPLADYESGRVGLYFRPGVLEASAQSMELGGARDEMPIEYDGETIRIWFNWHYLMDALRAVDGANIEFQFTDSGLPVLIRNGGELPYEYIAVVMPMHQPTTVEEVT